MLAKGSRPVPERHDHSCHRRYRHQRQDHDQGTAPLRTKPAIPGLCHRGKPEQPYRRSSEPAFDAFRYRNRHHRNGGQPSRRDSPAVPHRAAHLRHHHQHRRSPSGRFRQLRHDCGNQTGPVPFPGTYPRKSFCQRLRPAADEPFHRTGTILLRHAGQRVPADDPDGRRQNPSFLLPARTQFGSEPDRNPNQAHRRLQSGQCSGSGLRRTLLRAQ